MFDAIKGNKIAKFIPMLAIVLIGFAVYSSGLSNQFAYDDANQIVNATPVHSIKNIGTFFGTGTFFDGTAPLKGSYYRPLMTTTFSLIYTIFGANPFPYHLVQLCIGILSSLLLYLLFKKIFKEILAFSLSILFLLHPINSQIMFAIPSMQDTLFVFFGLAATYILFNFKSNRSLLLVVSFLVLSLLSKESGLLFVLMSGLYLLGFDKRRLLPFSGLMLLPLGAYSYLKVNAVGWYLTPGNAPIDYIGLAGRIIMIPQVTMFYILKFIFPQKLAMSYYWIHPTFDFKHFILPLIVELIVLAMIIIVALKIKRKNEMAFRSYLYFSTWAFLGMLLHLQIKPLDMTVCENWFYFPMIGLLGAIGVAITILYIPKRNMHIALSALCIIVLTVLGVRTYLRGYDWKDQNTITFNTLKATEDNYVALYKTSIYYYNKSDYNSARQYSADATKAFRQYAYSYEILGRSNAKLGNYPAAQSAYQTGLEYADIRSLYENLGALTTVYGTKNHNKQYLVETLQSHPDDPYLLAYLAIFEYREGNIKSARAEITKAAQLNTESVLIPYIYNMIINNQPLKIEASTLSSTI